MNIVLVGNPNVGKSVIFNTLTGSYATVSNYPGTTVDISKGSGRYNNQVFFVTDTPGVNSLSANSEDEKVTKEILSHKDINCLVQVADAKNLKRALLLTLELIELRLPMVLVLNMYDEAGERGISIDSRKLSGMLGIEVVETVAVTGEGIARLQEAMFRARLPNDDIRSGTDKFKSDPILLLQKRSLIADKLISSALTSSKELGKRISDAIGRLTIRPLSGIPLMLLVLCVMYFFVGRFAAGTVVDYLQNIVFGKYINPAVTGIIDRYISLPVLREALVGNYGIITMALTYAFAIIFPIVTAFFLFFGVLEDSGYLPRLAVLSDRVFARIGLNGRAILPMLLGLGCGTMAALTARILDSKKERILVTLLLTLGIPCSAQLGLIMGMLGGLSLNALFIWLGVLIFVLLLTGWAASKVIPGERCPFIQEIPPIRLPQARNIIIKTLARLKWYLKEAVPLFVLGTFILFIAEWTGVLFLIERFLSPLVVNMLNLPAKTADIFVIGFLRRDYGAAGLYAFSKTGALDHIQLLVSLVVITLFIPCVAQFIVTIKERGFRTAVFIGVFVSLFAICVGFLLNITLRYLIYNLGLHVL